LTGTGGSSNVIWYDLGSSPAQTYSGSGVMTAPITTTIQNAGSVTFNNTTNQWITNRINVVVGNITNANKITLGTGGATTGTVQIGNTTTPTAAGTFDVPLTFNLGSGGEVISYLRTTASRST